MAISPVSETSTSYNLTSVATEHLFGIFRFVIVDQCWEAATISLVCRRWQELMCNSYFWKDILSCAGLTLPSSVKYHQGPSTTQPALQALAYATSPWLLNRICACTSPTKQEIDTGIDFSKYPTIKFLEDTHVIAYNEFEICIGNLRAGNIQTITTSSKILSVCVTAGVLYYGLETKQIIPFSLNTHERLNYAILEAHVNEKAVEVPYAHDFMLLFANDKWLVSISNHFLKKWDRETGEMKGMKPFDYSMQQFQLDCDQLYWTCFTFEDAKILYSWDLNEDQSSQYELMSGKQTPHRIHVRGKVCSFIKGITCKEEDSDELLEESGDDGIEELSSIVSVNLHTGESKSFYVKTIGFDDNPNLITFNGLAILARSAYNQAATYDDAMTLNAPEIVEFIDQGSGKVAYRSQDDWLHNSGISWSIAVFQNTFFSVTRNNLIIKTTFTESALKKNEWSQEVEVQAEVKRRRTS